MDDIQLISGKRGTFQEYIAEVRANARNAALEKAAKACVAMQPAGGRAWTDDQLLCYTVLGDAAKNIRSLKS